MIAQLAGQIVHTGLDDVIIMAGSVGYRVLVAPSLAQELSDGSELTLHTSLVVREDSMTLYGFREMDERVIFEKLQSVSGIGPRTALAALSVLTPDDLRRAVSTKDLATLQKIPGVGKKSAERMALEIGDKLGQVAALPGQPAPVASGAVESEVKAALVQLGYTEAMADKALDSLGGQGLGASDLLRAALVKLGGQRGR